MIDDLFFILSVLSARLIKLDAETASTVRGIMDIIRLRENHVAMEMARLEARVNEIASNYEYISIAEAYREQRQ